MKPYLLASLIGNALLTVVLVWGAFLHATLLSDAVECAQALEVSSSRLQVAHTSIDVGERYFQVCLNTLEESSKTGMLCSRRLSACQGIR